ncbi:MAG: hypothetical protein LBV79_03355, partial [Candidatus Adiutrix sp.]|nr:hypothetical protein [Candidatus Adiutrix sp.]
MRKKLFIIMAALCLVAAGLIMGTAFSAPEKTYTNSIGMEFTLIPAGSFNWEGDWYKSAIDSFDQFGESVYSETIITDTPPRTITISKPFYMGTYEVTQKQW